MRLSSDQEMEELAEHELQNFIICLEMFFLSIAHSYAFPCQEFNIAHNPRSRAAILASEWAKNDKGSESFMGDDLRPAQGMHRR